MSSARGHGLILFIFINSCPFFREVIPGACSLLSNFITLNSMEASIAMGVQAVPVNKQEYIPYRRLYMQVASHHVIFNHQDLLLQLVNIKLNFQVYLLIHFYCIIICTQIMEYYDLMVFTFMYHILWLKNAKSFLSKFQFQKQILIQKIFHWLDFLH